MFFKKGHESEEEIHEQNTQATGSNTISKSNGNSGIGVPKPPIAPKEPLMPYMRFSENVWDSTKAANPGLPLWEIGKIIAITWRDMPEVEKQEYNYEYESEKQEYDRNMAMYKSSPANQVYIQAKSRGNGFM